MPQEVSGQLAFKYMHKDDVRWVMIALRQSIYSTNSFNNIQKVLIIRHKWDRSTARLSKILNIYIEIG